MLKYIVLLVITLCLGLYYQQETSLQQQTPTPFINAPYFSMDWHIYTFGNQSTPPINAPFNPNIRLRGTGKTYYDIENWKMLEVYNDFCIPIFTLPTRNFNFPCKFLNVNNISYLINIGKPTLERPECCIFQKDFHPPLQTFAVDTNMSFLGSYLIQNEWSQVFWLDGPMPAPFFYGWKQEQSVGGYPVPSMFSFPTVPPEDWTQQDFFNYKFERPDPSVFNLPNACASAKMCIWSA